MDFDAISESVGHFGRYQKYMFGLGCIGVFIPAMQVLSMTFVASPVKYRCVVPNCDDNSTHYEENFTEWAIPEGDQCHVWTLNNNITEQCQPDVFSNSTSSCSQWVYDTSVFSATTVTEFDLTCENAWLRPLGGSVYMIGMLVGAVLIGDLADRFGRRKGILVSVLLVGACGVMCSVSPNYYMFLLMRLFTGAGGCGLFLVTYILTLEFIGAKWRTFCGIIILISFPLGEAMTGVLAIFIRDWRWLQVAVTAPAFLLLSFTWLLPESVRWLVAEGRNDEANNIIHRVARVNNVDLPRHLTDLHDVQFGSVDGTLSVTNSNTADGTMSVTNSNTADGTMSVTNSNTVDGTMSVTNSNTVDGTMSVTNSNTVDGTMSVTNSNTVDGTMSVTNSNIQLVNETTQEAMIKKTVIDLLRTPVMRRRSFTLFFCWAVCAMVFYGLSSNTTSLGGNIFVDFISTMLVEIPSYIFTFLVLDRLGRKGTLSFVYLLGGVSCFISGFIPEGNYWLLVVLSLLGKFGISAAFAIVYIYSAEIFPTEYRTVGVGTCSMCARLGGILAPFTSSLADIYTPLPLLIFGVLSLVSGCLTVFLPETVGCELPQTLQESEAFGSDQSMWYFRCCSSFTNTSTPEANVAADESRNCNEMIASD